MLYKDNAILNPLYYGFYFQIKQVIKRVYLHTSGPNNRTLQKTIKDYTQQITYPTTSSFNELFYQSWVRETCSNNITCCGKYPSLHGDMSSIEPTNNKDKNTECISIERVVRIMVQLCQKVKVGMQMVILRRGLFYILSREILTCNFLFIQKIWIHHWQIWQIRQRLPPKIILFKICML